MVNLIGSDGSQPKKGGAMRSATYFKFSTFQKLKNFNPFFLDEKEGNGTDAILLLRLQTLIFVIDKKWNWIKKGASIFLPAAHPERSNISFIQNPIGGTQASKY